MSLRGVRALFVWSPDWPRVVFGGVEADALSASQGGPVGRSGCRHDGHQKLARARIQRVITLNLGTAKHAKASGSRSGVHPAYSPVRYASAAVSPPSILILENHLDGAGAEPM
jgi:hypothetical protein